MNTLSPRNRASETPSPNSRPCARPLSRACGLRVAAWLALSGALFIAAPANAQLAFSGTVGTIEHSLDDVTAGGTDGIRHETGPTVTTTLPEATGGTGTVTYACISFSTLANCAADAEARGITFVPGTRVFSINSARRTNSRGIAYGLSAGSSGTNYTVMFTATDSATPTPAVVTLTVTVRVYRAPTVSGKTWPNFDADGEPFTSQSTGSPSGGKGPFVRHGDIGRVDPTGTLTTFSSGEIVLDSDIALVTFNATGTRYSGRFYKVASGSMLYWVTDSLGAQSRNAVFNYNAVAVAPELPAINNDIEFPASDIRPKTLPPASGGTAPITYAVSIPAAEASWLKADTAPVDSPRVLSITVGTAMEGDDAIITYTATNSRGTATRTATVSVTGALAWMDAGNYPTDLTFNRFIDGYSITGNYTLPAASGGGGVPYVYNLVRGPGSNDPNRRWLLNIQNPNKPTVLLLGSRAQAGDSTTVTYTATDPAGSIITEIFSVYVIDSLQLSASTIFFELGTPKQETLPAATGGAGAYTYSLSGQDDVAWLEADVSSAANTPPVLSIIHTGANAAVNGDTHELTYTVSNTVGSVTTIFSVEVNALLGITAENLTFVAGDFTAQALDAATGGDGVYVYALTGDTGLNWLSIAHSDTSTVPMISINNFAVGGNTANFNYSATDSSGTKTVAFTITVVAPVSLGDGSDVFLTFTVGDTTAQALPSATGGGGGYAYTLDDVASENWLTATGGGASPYMLAINANAAETDSVVLTYSVRAAVDDMTILVNVKVIDELALVAEDLKFTINIDDPQQLPEATGGNKGPYTYTLSGDSLGDWLLVDAGDGTVPPTLSLQISGANTAVDGDSDMLTYTVTDATGTASATFGVAALDTLVFKGGEAAAMVLTFTVGQSNVRELPEGQGGKAPYTYGLTIPEDVTWLDVVERPSSSSQRRASASLTTLSSHGRTFTDPPLLTISVGSGGAGDTNSAIVTYTITDSSSPATVVTALINVGVVAAPAFPDDYSPVFVFTATQPSELTFLPVTGGAPPIEYTYATGDEGSDASDIVAWMTIPDPRSDGTPFVSGTPPTSQISVHTPALDEDSFNIEIMAEDFNGAEAGNAGIQAYVVVRRAPPKPDLPSELTTLGASPQLVDETTVAMTFTGLPTDSVQTVQGENAVVAAPNKSVLATPLTQELIISVINEDGSAMATFSSVSAFDAGDTSDYSVTSDDTHSQTVSAKFVHGGLTFSSLGFTTYSDTTGNYTYAPQFEVAGTFTTAGKYVFDFKATDKNGKSASSDSGTVTIGTGAGWDNDEYTFDTITLPVYELDDDGAITLPTIATTFPAAVAQADPNKMLNYGALVWVNDPDPADAIDLPLNLGIDYTPGAFTSGVAVPIAFTPNTGLFTDDANRAEMDDYIFRVEVSDDVCQACDAITLTVKVVEKSLAEAPSWDGHPGFYLVEVDSPSTLVDPATNEPYTQANGEFFIAEEGDENPDPRSIPLALTHTQDEDLKVTSANPFKALTYSALTWLDPVAADADSNGLPAVLGIEYTAATRASTDAVPISFTVDSGNAKFQAACANANAKECPFRESYEFELSATDIDGNTVMLTFTVNLSENELPPPRSTLTPPQGNYFEINRIVMSQIGEAIVSDTINVITDRLGSVRLQQTDAEPYFGVGGESSPSKIIAKNAKGLVDGTKTPKQLLNGARLVLPLIGEYGAPLPSGMAFWISANHSDMSADTDIVNWEGDMRNIYFGVDSTVSPRAVMGMAFNRANVELDYEDLRTAPETGEEKEYAGIGKYEIDLTGINPYVSWRHGKVDLWVTLGQSVGDLTITRLDDPDHNTQPANPDDQGVKTNLRLKTAAAGGSGLWATDGDSQLRVRGEVFTSRMEIDAAESNAGKEIDQNIAGTVAQTIDGGLVRLGLELVNPDILPGGARMEPMYEFGARYDYGESEVGGGIEAATGLRFSGAKNQVSGIFRLHGVTSSDGAYDEWGAYALLRNRAGGDGQGLSLDLRPSYGADDSIDLWQAALETATQTALDPSQYAMQIAARIGYGITGGRGLLTPFTEWTHRDYDTYRLGVDWSPHDDFTLNLIGETEQLPSGDQQSVLLQGTINF